MLNSFQIFETKKLALNKPNKFRTRLEIIHLLKIIYMNRIYDKTILQYF